MDFEWSERGWVANGMDFEWGLKSGSPTILNPKKWPPFCQKKHLKFGQKRLDFEWLGL